MCVCVCAYSPAEYLLLVSCSPRNLFAASDGPSVWSVLPSDSPGVYLVVKR